MTASWRSGDAGVVPRDPIPRLVVAGTASGVGKTTIAAAALAAFRRRGLAVAPFKVGPDYIDPTYHALAAGRACRNLDSWILPRDHVLALFERATRGADLAVVEGVMGLFDGRNEAGESGSTAEVAGTIGAPVVLVLDVGKQARSAAATAVGFQRFDPATPLAGFILNRVGSPRHAALVRREVEAVTGLPVLGAFPKQALVELPERHLGLVPTQELERARDVVGRLAELAREHLDLDALLATARAVPALASMEEAVFPAAPIRCDEPGLAVARDEAFSFYYEDSLDLLAAFGARLLPFSPLRAGGLPDGARGLYLGGGFPELFADRLASNRALLGAVRRAAAEGMPIYAECGGLMYLAESLVDLDGREHRLSGLLPCRVAMMPRRAALGYVRLRARTDTLLCGAGRELRGHEFHWSRLSAGAEQANAYDVLDPARQAEGFARGSMLASYVHLHFGADPRLAQRFVAAL